MLKESRKKIVSIVVSIYNTDKYLSECINSLINQKYKEIEILLIDDGSTDSSKNICKEYLIKDSRIVYIHKDNSGVSSTRNLGIEKAKGEFIVFVDSDDIVDSNYINMLIDSHEEHSLSVCRLITFKDKLSKANNANYDCFSLSKSNFIELYNIGILNTPCCKLFEKKIIDRYNIKFNEKITLGEDLLFNFSYLKVIKKIKVVNLKLYYYRFHGSNSLTTSYIHNAKDIQLMLLDEITEYFKEITNYKTLNNLRMERIISIVDNELKNNNISFYKRYINARKVLSDKEIKKRIKDYKKDYSKINFFLLKNNFFILYKIKKKLIG